MDVPAQEERERFPPLPFCSPGACNSLDDAHPHWGRRIFIQSTQSNANSSRNTFIHTPEVMFYQLSGYRLAQLSRHIKVTLTPYLGDTARRESKERVAVGDMAGRQDFRDVCVSGRLGRTYARWACQSRRAWWGMTKHWLRCASTHDQLCDLGETCLQKSVSSYLT